MMSLDKVEVYMKVYKNSFYANYIKRILDIALSVVGILLLWPIYLVVAVLIRIKLGSPVIFCQERPGRNEKIFKLYKFRSMTDKRDTNGELLPDAVRLTGFGRMLRSSSLDELPELFNILKGDMSVVGPRPLAVQYLSYYNETERHRHDVRPGLTGLAQVSGRTALEWEKRFAYDLEYIENISIAMDIKIFLKTVQKVFLHEDIVEAGCQGNFDDFRRQQQKEEQINVTRNWE